MKYYIINLSDAIKIIRFKELEDMFKKKRGIEGEIAEFNPQELCFILSNIMRGYISEDSEYPIIELSSINKNKMYFEINLYEV